MQTSNGWFAMFTVAAALVTTLLAAPADAAQSRSADSRRLHQLKQGVQTELRHLDEQPSASSAQLRDDLEDLRDEIGYLRVTQRRGGEIEERQYRELESRLQSVRREIRSAGSRANGSSDARYEIPVGTELDVRLQDRLYSDTAKVEDRFEATTVVDLNDGERLLVPAGSVLRGVVTSVDRASRKERRGSITVIFDKLTVQGRTHDIRASVVRALEADVKGDVGRIGAGAGVGAIIGGILGGAKGALAGILIGAGGTVLATEGKDVDLQVGTIMRVRFESPVQIAHRGR